jgi:hypothetical protein
VDFDWPEPLVVTPVEVLGHSWDNKRLNRLVTTPAVTSRAPHQKLMQGIDPPISVNQSESDHLTNMITTVIQDHRDPTTSVILSDHL